MPKVPLAEMNEANLVAEGTYRARLTKTEAAPNQKGDMVDRLTFKITDEDSEAFGRVASLNGTLNAKQLWAYKAAIIALGGSPEWFSGAEYDTDWSKSLIGNEALIEVAHYTRNDGQKGYSVNRVYPIDDGSRNGEYGAGGSEIPF